MDEYTVVVNGVAWPTPAIDGIKWGNKFMLDDAERTQGTMHFELQGEVWTLDITWPSLTEAEYNLIYNSLRPFVVTVDAYNTLLNKRLITTFYRTDLELTRHWRDIYSPFTVKLIGTEIIKHV